MAKHKEKSKYLYDGGPPMGVTHVILPWIAVVRNSIRRKKGDPRDRDIPLVLHRDPRASVVNPAFENTITPPYYGRTLPAGDVIDLTPAKINIEKTYSELSNGSRKYEHVDHNRSYANGDTPNGLSAYETAGTLLRNKDEERKLKSQEKWKPGLGYYASWICIALGLVNLWRFPSVAYDNGGGAFLFAYVVAALLIGLPMFILETAVGQFTGNRPHDAWRCIPLLRGLTWAQLISSFHLMVCLLHVMGISLVYLLDSFQGSPFPWSRCPTGNDTACNETIIDGSNYTVTAQEVFLRYRVWQDIPYEKGVADLNWYLAVACLVATCCVALCIVKGFWVIRKVAFLVLGYATLCFLSFLIFLLVDLNGTGNGIKTMFFPEWKNLNSLELWYKACEHVLITTGIGLGPLVTYSSKNHFNNNIVRHSILLVLFEIMFSILCFLVISASLGNMASLTNGETKHLLKSNSGMSLVFVSASHLFSNLSFVPMLWLFLFFLAVFLLGLISVIVLSDVILNLLWDKMKCAKNRKWLVRTLLCLLAAGIDIVLVQTVGPRGFDILDRYGIGAPCVVFAVLEVISMTWIYGLDNFRSDVSFMVQSRIPGIVAFLWVFFVPVGLAGVGIAVLVSLVLKWTKEGIPDVPYFVAEWIVFAMPMAAIFAGVFASLCDAIALGCCDRFRYVLSISPDWGPSDPFYRRQWLRGKHGHSPRATSTLRSNGHVTHTPVHEGSISTISRSWNT